MSLQCGLMAGYGRFWWEEVTVGGWVVVEEWRQDDGAGGEGCVCEEGLIRQERTWSMPRVLCISFWPPSFIHSSLFIIQESIVILNSRISYKNKLIPSLNLNFIKNIHNIHPHKSEVIIIGQEKCLGLWILTTTEIASIDRLHMVSNKTLCRRLNIDHYMITNEAPSMSLALFN
jgi:hypothetical protein